MLTVILSMIAIIVSVIGLFIDQMRYNNAAYKDYSNRIQLSEQAIKSNDLLLKQTDLQQKQIMELQNQIIKLLKK